MMKSPCIGCELEAADKNNPTCRECDRRVEYVALIAGDGGSIMGETKETGAGDQISEVEGRRKVEKECIIEGCSKKAVARKLCSTHNKAWSVDRIEHPELGKYFTIRPRKKKEVKKQKSEVRSQKAERAVSAEVKKAALPPLVAVQLSLYPEIHKAVYDTAEKFFVTPEHVIIGLLGEALAARTRLRDASPGKGSDHE